MTDIEICEKIIENGSCDKINCSICPLGKCNGYPCGIRFGDEVSAAKLYLEHHKNDKTMTREEAIIAMVDGEKVQHENYNGDKKYYNFYNNGHFYRIVYGVTAILDVRNMSDYGWSIYKELTKVWQFAYKAQGNANNVVGEVSKYMTEEQAKEKYGDNCIKLEWTEKEVEM